MDLDLNGISWMQAAVGCIPVPAFDPLAQRLPSELCVAAEG